jgi:hypothetical protein
LWRFPILRSIGEVFFFFLELWLKRCEKTK